MPLNRLLKLFYRKGQISQWRWGVVSAKSAFSVLITVVLQWLQLVTSGIFEGFSPGQICCVVPLGLPLIYLGIMICFAVCPCACHSHSYSKVLTELSSGYGNGNQLHMDHWDNLQHCVCSCTCKGQSLMHHIAALFSYLDGVNSVYLCVLANVSVCTCADCGFFPFRLDAASKATTLVHSVFGGYLRSRGGCSVSWTPLVYALSGWINNSSDWQCCTWCKLPALT